MALSLEGRRHRLDRIKSSYPAKWLILNRLRSVHWCSTFGPDNWVTKDGTLFFRHLSLILKPLTRSRPRRTRVLPHTCLLALNQEGICAPAPDSAGALSAVESTGKW
ncbi:hypothetical protein SBA4_2550007 [Candidatus Sulfopaludibacter sp. SbA4]|nr:hypothetical protein SBA4_2550007 [Candidatus Sulfopaludibacter sp. SbA4]